MPEIGGFTARGNNFDVLNFTDMTTEELAGKVKIFIATSQRSVQQGQGNSAKEAAQLMIPICQGTNSWSPRPSFSPLEASPEAVRRKSSKIR